MALVLIVDDSPTEVHVMQKALEQHGFLKGAWLAIRRLARCHPLGGSGLDPVPPPRPR